MSRKPGMFFWQKNKFTLNLSIGTVLFIGGDQVEAGINRAATDVDIPDLDHIKTTIGCLYRTKGSQTAACCRL